MFANGTGYKYKGERTFDTMLKFAEKILGPASHELDEDELRAIIKETDLRVICSNKQCILVNDDKEVLDKYQQIARKIEDYEFYHTSLNTAQKVFPNVTQNQVIVLKGFDEGHVALLECFLKNAKILKDFLDLHMFPIVNNLTDKTLEKVLSSDERKGLFMFRSDNDTNRKEYDKEFRKLASEMRSKDYLFFVSDIQGELPKQIADTLGVDESSLPLVQSVELNRETIMYRYEGKITEQTLQDFVAAWKAGTLKRYFTSEPIPTENPGPIYKVVGKTFVDEVINNDQSVFVRYYAPWCEFSGILEPIYKRIAEAMVNNKEIKFCEIDSTKNDIEGYPFEGYPVIKFFPAGKKDQPFYYNGDFTEEALAKFIQENVKIPVILPQESMQNYGKTEL